MSFQHKAFWIQGDSECLTGGEMGYENSSRIEPKRSHQWFTDADVPETFNNKKQTLEGVNNRCVSGISHMNVSPWHNASNIQSGFAQFSDRRYGSEPVSAVDVGDRSIPSVEGGSSNMGRKDYEDLYNNASIGLSMSHFVDPSCFNYGGIRKVKVNQVRDSANGVSAMMGHSFSREGNDTLSMGISYKGDNDNISLGPNNNNSNENVISMGHAYRKADSSFISMSQTFNKGEEDCISMGYNYSKINENTLPMGQSFLKGDANPLSIGQSSDNGDSNIISLGSYYVKRPETFISTGHSFGKVNENFISMASSYGKDSSNVIEVAHYDKAGSNLASMGSTDKGDSGVLSMGHDYNKGENSTISFGGFEHETESNPYDLMVAAQNTAQASEEPRQKDLIESNVDSGTPKMGPKGNKSKEPKTAKKAPANNFPSNVKSLLSTGMLDGIPVKYVSWSREKNLKGTIKGTGYLCGCSDCNYNKTLNAYEFERHANCKTKHPNNHIYFENGKTIYAIVQELKNTPQELLFDVIQSVTGSQINQKNFRIWKASYQAATRELQRIYGRDEITMPS